jgi:trans-o-hydroxybenzylidenepyruvate hydratase-aldolase
MLTAKDLRGVCVMVPTPCKEGADKWDAVNSVDLEESQRMVDKLIKDGIGIIAACGTTGECAALLWEEKKAFIDTISQVNRNRVPLFAGATALGTKEVVRQMRGLKEVGAHGAFVGLPLWQTPTIENSVQFFADLSEAVPDMPIMIYSNSMFFKSAFPTIFWEGLAKKAPTVITTKVTYGIGTLLDDIRVAGHQINFLPGQNNIYPAYKMARPNITACWSTSALMGPEPVVALMEAIQRDDEKRVDKIWEDMRLVPAFFPPGAASLFPQYNAQAEKWRFNASGYVTCGPSRAPYRDLPDNWKRQAELHAKGWVELRKKFVKS